MIADWPTFLKNVDETEPDEEVLNESLDFLQNKAKLADPGKAVGISLEKLEKQTDFPDGLAVQAFLSRTMDALAAVAAARRVSLGTVMASPPSTGSAISVAHMLSPLKSVDSVKLLAGNNMADLPFALRIEQPLIDKMMAETDGANKGGRPPFLYVDLTSKEVLPLWITPEQIGGKSDLEGDSIVNSGVSSLAELGAALNKATENRRCFTSAVQWMAAWSKYTPWAICCGHLTLAQATQHTQTILMLVDAERNEGNGPAVAVVYDEMLRRMIEKRSASKDPTLNLGDLLAEPDKPTLAQAKQRVRTLMKGPLSSSAGTADGGALARAFAADQKREAQEAARALREQNDNRRQAGQALLGTFEAAEPATNLPWMRGGKGKGKSSKSGRGRGSGGGGQPQSQRKQKRSDWWQGMNANWQAARAWKKSKY